MAFLLPTKLARFHQQAFLAWKRVYNHRGTCVTSQGHRETHLCAFPHLMRDIHMAVLFVLD